MTEDQVREMMRQAGLESGFGWVCAYLAKVATARQNELPLSEGPVGFVRRVIDGIKVEVHSNQIPGKQYIQKKILSSLSHGGDLETDKVKKLDRIAEFPESPVLSKEGEASMRLEFRRTTYASELARLTHVRTVEKENRGALLAAKAEEMVGYFQWRGRQT